MQVCTRKPRRLSVAEKTAAVTLLFELLLLVPAQQVYEARPGEGVRDVQGGQAVPGNDNIYIPALPAVFR